MSDALQWERLPNSPQWTSGTGYRITADKAGDDTIYRVYHPTGCVGVAYEARIAKAMAEAHREQEDGHALD